MIGVPKEVFPGEKRVATVPDVVPKLAKLGFSVIVQSGAGEAASIGDEAYAAAGAVLVPDAGAVWSKADIIFKVRAPTAGEVQAMHEGQTLVAFIWPAQNPELMQSLAAKNVTVLAMDSVPRMSRAQKMDALSSMANIAGYRAVIEAAHHFGRFFTGQITAAGKVPPAKVFVIGAGVAGLAAIGTAAGLGAIVRANDTRPEVADQVKSLGGEFVPVEYQEEGTGVGGYAKVMSEGFQKAQRETFAKQAKEVDIIITTALIPGKPAPKLITAEMVRSMKPGSVIVDLAAEQGGNCELTEPGQVVVKHGVTIIGYTDLPSRLANQSSTLYANNLFRPVRGALQEEGRRHQRQHGRRRHPRPDGHQGRRHHVAAARAEALGGAGEAGGRDARRARAREEGPRARRGRAHGGRHPHGHVRRRGAILFLLIGAYAPPAFLGHFTVFVLAVFVGYMVVWNVTPALHTPLMSVTNAISSIIAIGALVQIAPPLAALGGDARPDGVIRWLAVAGIALTAINMFGGFAVTRRMLAMFRK